MTMLGMQQAVVAKDGSPLTHPGLRVAETIAPGQTMDAIATVPAGATGQFALMDGSLNLFNNRAQGFGGMLTFLSVGGTPPAAGPDRHGALAPGQPVDGHDRGRRWSNRDGGAVLGRLGHARSACRSPRLPAR